MKEIIKINKVRTIKEIPTCNARELHKFLESKRAFSNWINYKINRYNFIENQDYIKHNNFVIVENSNLKRPQIDFYLTINTAKELAMLENNEKGKQARQYFIECEQQLKEKQKNISTITFLKQQLQLLENHENRLQKLENENEEIKKTKQLLQAPIKEQRAELNQIVRQHANNHQMDYRSAWNTLYTEFYYTYHVNLSLKAKNRNLSIIKYAEENNHIKDLFLLARKIFKEL